jgi:hypothetical protein
MAHSQETDMDTKSPEPVDARTDNDAIISLGVASRETKGGGAYPQPDTNQPSRQAFGIQTD